MRKFLLSLCVALLSCATFAQTSQNIYVVMKDNSALSLPAEKFDSIAFDVKNKDNVKEYYSLFVTPAEEIGLKLIYDKATLTACVSGGANQNETQIHIPSKVRKDGSVYSVTKIGNSAFNTCYNLTSVDIPNTVTKIEEYAFKKLLKTY